MERRRLVLLIVVVVILAGAVVAYRACRQPPRQRLQLVWVSWGGKYQDSLKQHIFDAFQKDTGIECVSMEYTGAFSQIEDQVKRREVSWDLVQIESADLQYARRMDYLDPIELSEKVWGGILPDAQFRDSNTATQRYAVGAIGWSYGLAWDSDQLPSPPASWAEFFDVERFPQRRIVRDTPYLNMEIAQFAKGVTARDIYRNVQLQTVFEPFTTLENRTLFYTTGDQLQGMLLNGQAPLALVVNGRYYNLKKDRPSWRYSSHLSLWSFDWWISPKGAPNRAAVARFFEWLATSDNATKGQAAIAREFGYGPSVAAAYRLLDDAILREIPTSEANLRAGFSGRNEAMRWWDENRTAAENAWQDWKNR